MQDGLAVQADQRDALARNRKSLKKRLDRRDMGVGHVALELELRRLGFAQVRDHRAQALGHVLGVGEGRGGPGLRAAPRRRFRSARRRSRPSTCR